jgi:hypothetical protein
MLILKSIEDLHKNSMHQNVFDCAKKTVENYTCSPTYEPDEDGFVCVLEHDDDVRDVEEVFYDIEDGVSWDGVDYDQENHCFVACECFNNQFVATLIVENEPWVDKTFPNLRNELEEATVE